MRSRGSRQFWRDALRVVALSLMLALGVLVLDGRPAAAEPLTASEYRMAGDATRVRIVMELDREPQFRWFLLRGPHRLVVDLPETRFALDTAQLKPRGLVTNVRYGNLDDGQSRMIFTGKGPFAVERIDLIQNESRPGFRLVADIVAASDEDFETALAEQAATTGATRSTDKGDRVGRGVDQPRPFTIVIDPGHGGIDGGAEGVSGTVEKDLTLAFSLGLRDALEKSDAYRVFMTREDDTFLRLDERVRIARQHGADLFLSVHADTIRYKGISGATVYTLSEKASDEVAEAAADRENLADAVAGVELPDESKEVADILIDLIRRETHVYSVGFARSLIDSFKGSIDLINNPHRSAGFKVLRAPDVPSVLVELGYLSNRDDETRMNSPEWRAKAYTAIAGAIGQLAAARAAAGG